ncbi:MAG: tRNA lysidine(34) synthetase TilS [Candidatus Omnitrophota bacterium]
MTLQKIFHESVSSQRLLKAGDTVIVGVSGGADSVALLTLINDLKYDLGLRIIAAHVNHRLRKSADKDEDYVKALCSRYGIRCVTQSVTIKKEAQVSPEDAARRKRFSALGTIARRYSADALALAHHRDDLAETVLMRILRGTGLKGLEAMTAMREINGIPLIRPLLDAGREDIEKFLKKRDLRYRTDPTNRSRRFLRNRIRHDLIPLLERDYKKGVKHNLAALADIAGNDYDYLKQQAEKIVARWQVNRSGITVPLKSFNRLHPAMQRMALCLGIQKILPSSKGYPLSQIDAIRSAAINLKQPLHAVSGISLSRSKETLSVSPRSS